MRRFLPLLLIAAIASAQSPARFDAASVKPAVIPPGVSVVPGGAIKAPAGSAVLRNTGGPGSEDPGRIHYPFISLKTLIRRAFEPVLDITAPPWTEDDMMTVDATMPPDTGKERFQAMLRNLLAERFNLKCHTATKQASGYSLVVARGGSKLKPAAPAGAEGDAAQQDRDRGPARIGPDGFPAPPAHFGPGFMFQTDIGDRMRILGQGKTMSEFAAALGGMLHSKVADATGLNERFDIVLACAGHFGPNGPAPTLPGDTPPPLPPGREPSGPPLADIFSALQSELGLKLEPSKVAVEILVVDHVEETPEGN